MKSNITSRLLENFDSTSFMKTGQPCKEILDFYDTPQQVDEFYRLTESAWPQIDWQKISKLKTNGWMVISFLCEASYKHCFPSLLMELKKNDNLLTDLFTENHLTLSNVYKEWEINFYLSLNERARELVGEILRGKRGPLALAALESYWQ